MLWAFLSVVSGLGDAVIFALMKKLKPVNSSIIVWVQYAFALPFLLILLYFNYPQKISLDVYWIAALNGILLIITTYMLVKALQTSKLSVSLPMLSLTPLFLVMLSYFMLREIPSEAGFIGIILIVAGAYIVNIKNGEGFFEPFNSLFKIKGSFYVIIVAFVWSITSNLFKMGIIASNALFFTVLVYFFISLVMLPLFFIKFNEKLNQLKINFKLLAFLGVSSAFMIALASYAMASAIVPYVISLKRSSLIFSIFIGYFVFKERNIRNSLIGTAIMLIGGILITLF
ncbi:DMT family transporter [Candidatus Woesearchaeota archaeon]|nr:DMT family transporter [Candidatus Woesearchaeota archaeon]